VRPDRTVVLLLEGHGGSGSWFLSIVMGRLKQPVIPCHGYAGAYTKEITIANDGIVNPKRVLPYADRLLNVILQELDHSSLLFRLLPFP